MASDGIKQFGEENARTFAMGWRILVKPGESTPLVERLMRVSRCLNFGYAAI
jgi:hypothetical protein